MSLRVLVATFVGGVVPAGVVASIAAAGILWGGSETPSFALDGLPDGTAHSYRFIESQPALAKHIPCYCGCYSLRHESLLNCFVRPQGGYERHASDCGICGMEADVVEELVNEGADAHTIRTTMDANFSKYGKPTNTPEGP